MNDLFKFKSFFEFAKIQLIELKEDRVFKVQGSKFKVQSSRLSEAKSASDGFKVAKYYFDVLKD